MSVRSSALFVAMVSSVVWAQVPPISSSIQPYVPLTGATVGVPVARSASSFLTAGDEGIITIPLNFAFPYFGQTYNTVYADTNGFLMLGTAGCTSSCLTGTSFPTAAAPNNIIGGFWDDFDLDISAAAQIRYVSTASELVVEYVSMPFWDDVSSTATFQIRLTSSGLFTIHHGTATGSMLTGAVGFENSTGTVGANLISGCTTACNATHWVPNRLFQVGEPDDTDLGVASVTFENLVRLPDDNITFTVNSTLRNFGRTPTDGGFEWAAYLSRDRSLDVTATDGGADILVATGSSPELPAVLNGVTADGGQATVNVTASAATTVPPPTGEYFVLVLADSTNVVPEASESNNVGSSLAAFVQGVDIVATSITGVATSTGGADAGVTVSFMNRGASSPDAGVPFRVLLSSDALLDSTDVPIFTATRAMTAGQVITEPLSFAMPVNVPAGEFFYLLQIDPPQLGLPNGVIEEASETNNAVASTGKVTITRSDLVADSIEFLDVVTNLSTVNARFGEAVRTKIRYRNAGQVAANNFRVGLVLSSDSSLSLLSDTTVCSELIPTLAPSATFTETTLDCTLPLVARDGTTLTTGQYFVFGQVDVTSAVYETNEQNNSQVLGPIRMTAPGADVAVTAITAPASAGVGEVIPVTRSIRNLGNVSAPEVKYRFYASANDIITTDDVLLQIVDGANLLDEGAVTLAAGVADTSTELVRLPVSLPAGTYYVGCIVDPTRTIADDLEPLNNALASRTMAVAASSLRVANTSLPDAVIGRPFSYRLSATGEQGPSTWRIDPTLGAAPAWLSLGASDGLLSGTPTGTGGAEVVGVTVVVENSGRSSIARLALRVLPTTSGLEVLTASVPAVVNSSSTQYDFSLGAAGGVQPYTWRVSGGTLPTGMALSAAGHLTGAPRNTPNGTLPVSFEVRDAVGGRAARQLSIRVIAPGAITFRTIAIPDALIGQEYLQDIAVANQDGSTLARPLVWRVSGALPGGLSVTPQAELITVSGRATQAGTFTFSVSVEDNNGRSDSLEFTMTVHPARYRVLAVVPEVLRPGETISVPLSVTPSGTVSYRVVNGVLPPGLVVEPAGVISGTVNEDGSEGTWSFVLEARDEAGISGVTPFALRVERAPRTVTCSAVPVDASMMLVALGALALLSRRRSR